MCWRGSIRKQLILKTLPDTREPDNFERELARAHNRLPETSEAILREQER